ncbi:MAG: hypothetical protein B7Z74_04740, partial [Deltaproteobacteria bacterium 21-66-5]
MTTARQLHTATPLANGKVLIAGGQDNSSTILSSAEIYSAASGVFATTGPMTTAREQHTATRLPSGDVLITGGKGASILASAEIYSAASGVFATTGSMVTARYFHSAVLLPNGKVLVAGGIGTGGNLASAELYDPATKTFSPTGSMITARYEFTATLLPSGKVLIAGGTGNAGVLNSAELYDPAGNAGVGRFATTGNMAVPRSGPTATLLPNGKVLIYGGSGGIVGSTAYYPPSAELYDGTTSFSTAGSTVMARYGHSATMLSNGLVLVAGGQNSATTYTNTAD